MMVYLRAILARLAVSVALLLVSSAVAASVALARYPVPGEAGAPPSSQGTLSGWWALVVIGAVLVAAGVYAWLAGWTERATRREATVSSLVGGSTDQKEPSERKAA